MSVIGHEQSVTAIDIEVCSSAIAAGGIQMHYGRYRIVTGHKAGIIQNGRFLATRLRAIETKATSTKVCFRAVYSGWSISAHC